MIRKAIIMISAFAVLLAPTVLCAQGLIGGSQGLPFFGESLGGLLGTDKCDPGCDPFFYVGYIEGDKGLSYSGDYPESPWYESADQPIQGIWLGLSKTLRLNKDFGAMISGGALIPFERNFTLFINDDGAISYEDYKHDDQWTMVEILGTYNMLGLGEALFGFRWDHFTTRWTSVDRTDVDYYNFKLNYFLPVLGVQSKFGTAGNQVVARLLGFPYAPGNVLYDYQEPGVPYSERAQYNFGSNSYFLEAELNYIWRPAVDACAGLFFRYNTIHSPGEGIVEENINGALDTETHILGLHRTAWTLGGMFSYNFDLGGLL